MNYIKINRFEWLNPQQIISVYYHENNHLEIKLADKQCYSFYDEEAVEKFNLLKEHGIIY